MYKNEKINTGMAKRGETFFSTKTAQGTAKQVEKLCQEMVTANAFCCLGDRSNVCDGCEAVVTSKPSAR